MAEGVTVVALTAEMAEPEAPVARLLKNVLLLRSKIISASLPLPSTTPSLLFVNPQLVTFTLRTDCASAATWMPWVKLFEKEQLVKLTVALALARVSK